jgi:ParB-like chromosome segregation protein Spo0J
MERQERVTRGPAWDAGRLRHLERNQLELLPVAELRPQPRNPRTHSPKQIHQIAEAIKEFGFTNPILIDEERRVIAGHGRLEAAKLLKMTRVPVLRLAHMTEAQKRAYVIADNKLAENAGWDRELLGLELQYLSELDLEFEVTITGFETAEVDLLIQSVGENPDEEEEVPQVDRTAVPVTRVGDLWELGEHRILCGDATQPTRLRPCSEIPARS